MEFSDLPQTPETPLSLDPFSNKDTFYIFTSEGLFIKDSIKKPSEQQISPSERLAEISIQEVEDEKGKVRYLRIDLLKPQNYPENIRKIISWYLANSGEEIRKDLIVMINIPSKGDLRIPLKLFINPNYALNQIINNPELFIERKNIRYWVKKLFKEAQNNDLFLKLLYTTENLEEVNEFLTKLLNEKLNFVFYRNQFSAEALSYFEKLRERFLQRYIDLKKRFKPSKVKEILDKSDEEIYEAASQLKAYPSEYFESIIFHSSDYEEKVVEVERIISGQHQETGTDGNNWADHLIRRGKDRMKGFIRKILNGEINLDDASLDNGYNLLDLGNGFYIVINGHHRTVIFKLLGVEKIKARVYKLIPEKGSIVEVPFYMVEILKQRISNGLIKGKLEQKDEGIWILKVEDFVGPWVFYRNMAEAENFFNSH